MASYQKYTTKTKGNLWLYIVEGEIDPKTGKRNRVLKRGFKTKKEAQAEAVKLESEFASRTYIKESEILFEEFVEEWFELYSLSGVKASSVKAHKVNLVRILELLGCRKLKDITPKMYQTAINKLGGKFSYAYTSAIHNTCGMVFRKAVDLEVIKRDPSEKAKIPKKVLTIDELNSERMNEKFLEKKELLHLLEVAKSNCDKRDYVILLVLAYSGMRIGELLALKWSDIDFEMNKVKINKTLYRERNTADCYTLTLPKTRTSIRVISMDENVLEVLKEYKKEKDELIDNMGEFFIDEDFIFSTEKGRPLFYENVSSRIKRLASMTGIPKKITAHTFRHTHTSLLIEAGVGIKEIQDRLGHSDMKTTLGIYAHMTKEMESMATMKFSAFMQAN